MPSGFTAVTTVIYRRQDSAVRLRAGRSGFQIPAETKDSSLLQKVQTECKNLSAFCSTDNWLQYETDHSRASSAEVEWSYTSIPPYNLVACMDTTSFLPFIVLPYIHTSPNFMFC